ncbi:OpgC domain-containing protein [Xylophilus sp. GOD-11R]|uniref:OpgC domain-containing protein n=1 Tax=Xylophilus sp. GOD-11R TaxID=3089814 RepID=UPI00298D5B28|nr:OpgC domain-containing protein [Xylophilus sp. GOD-11R]WPB55065.1 OpgC domain-containing protein [Xylophilus sp. GOD-11R]
MPPASKPASSSRRWEIDALRGLMLVLMTITHLPTRLTTPLGQPFGFVSAAEGFVLLSAYMAGLVYGRLAWRKSVAEMEIAFWKRALKVYWCQAATLGFLFTVIAFIGVKFEQVAVTDLMSFYLQRPFVALISGLMLVYEPPLLDILPLYVLFMLLSPWVLALALRHGWAPVMVVSLFLWILAQFGLGEWIYNATSSLVPMPVPFHETGSFATYGWQLLWMVGLWMGASRNDPQARPFTFPNGILVASVFVAVTCMVWRHKVGQAPFEGNEHLNLLFDKWLLGPLRALDLAALAVLTIRFGPSLTKRLPRQHYLETLGKASLPVFCAHLVVVLLTLTFFGARFDRPWWQDLLLLIACFGSLYVVARVSLWIDKPPEDEPRDAARSPRGLQGR